MAKKNAVSVIDSLVLDLPACDFDITALNEFLNKDDLTLIDHTGKFENHAWPTSTGPITDISLGEVLLEGWDYAPIVKYVKDTIGVDLHNPKEEIKVYTTTQGIARHIDKFRLFTINIPLNDAVKTSKTCFYADDTTAEVAAEVQYADTPKMMNIRTHWHAVLMDSTDRRNMLTVSINPDGLEQVNADIRKQFGY